MVSMRGPSTSYDLKRAVNRSIGYFWPFPHAQLYSEPKRLVDLGLLEVHQEDGGRRRQLYSATPAGLDALRSWLGEPTAEQMQVRDVAELKLFFAEFAKPEDVLELAGEQVAQHRARIADYEAIQEHFRDRTDVAARMVPLGLGLAMERAALDFWEQLERERS